MASVLYQPVRAVYSKRFGLATQIHGNVYKPRITAATHDNCHELIHYSSHQLDLNGETYASTQTTLFLVLVYPVWWTQMLEKDVVGSVCVYVRLNMSLLHSSRRCCKVFTLKQVSIGPGKNVYNPCG